MNYKGNRSAAKQSSAFERFPRALMGHGGRSAPTSGPSHFPTGTFLVAIHAPNAARIRLDRILDPSEYELTKPLLAPPR